MNADNLNFSLNFVQWLVMAVIAIYTWLTNRHSATTNDQTEMDKRITKAHNEIEQRVKVLEVRMEEVPTEERISHLLSRLERLEAQLEGNFLQMQAMNRNLERINEYLLNSNKRA